MRCGSAEKSGADSDGRGASCAAKEAACVEVRGEGTAPCGVGAPPVSAVATCGIARVSSTLSDGCDARRNDHDGQILSRARAFLSL
eukprot:2536074-Rhodomonas_salina.5